MEFGWQIPRSTLTEHWCYFSKIIGFQEAFVPSILFMMCTEYFNIRLQSYVSQFTADSSDFRTVMRATWGFVSMNYAALSGQ
jgi:hypothetical protein